MSAGIAQLVEYKLPKLGVAGSNPVARSTVNLIQEYFLFIFIILCYIKNYCGLRKVGSAHFFC